MKSKKSKSRAKHRCPPKLQELMTMINLVPPGVGLPDLKAFAQTRTREILREWNKSPRFDPFARSAWEIETQLDELPSGCGGLKQHLQDYYNLCRQHGTNQLGPDVEFNLRSLQLEEYDFTRVARQRLEQIINASGDKSESSPSPRTLQVPVAYWVEDGKIKFTTDRFVDALSGAEANRIRLCEICRRVFWAARKDAWACSARCANVRRVRKSLAKREKGKRAQRLCLRCGHPKRQHFPALASAAAGCEGDNNTCACAGFQIKTRGARLKTKGGTKQ